MLKNISRFCLPLLLCFGILSGCGATEQPSADQSVPGTEEISDEQTPSASDADDISYKSLSADWPFYQDAQELVDNSTLIVLGNVTGITFEVLDTQTALPATDETEEQKRCLHTLYEIDITEQYKGNPVETAQVRVLGGLKDSFLDEQAAALGEDIENGIPILEDAPIINVGGTYLFVLYQSEDTAPTLLNLEQSVFDMNNVEDQTSLISAEEVISYFD